MRVISGRLSEDHDTDEVWIAPKNENCLVS